jgi:hypothetical protein
MAPNPLNYMAHRQRQPEWQKTLKLARTHHTTVEEWDVWPQGPRLQGEDGGKAGARESNKTIEQPNNRTLTRHRDIIYIYQDRT